MPEDKSTPTLLDPTSAEDKRELAGAATGATISLLGGWLLGASVGPAGTFFLEILKSLASHRSKDLLLSDVLLLREEGRMRLALESAKQQAETLRRAGKPLRSDAIDENGVPKSTAELLEHSLRAVCGSAETKKARHIGKLWTNYHFMPHIPLADARTAVSVSAQLSYRQICLVALYGRDENDALKVKLRRTPYYESSGLAEADHVGWKKLSLITDMQFLASVNLVLWRDVNRRPTMPHSPLNLIPRFAMLTSWGSIVHDLLSLEDIDETDAREAVGAFLDETALLCPYYCHEHEPGSETPSGLDVERHYCYYTHMAVNRLTKHEARQRSGVEDCHGLTKCQYLTPNEKGQHSGPHIEPESPDSA
jgi:hypothetical protein